MCMRIVYTPPKETHILTLSLKKTEAMGPEITMYPTFPYPSCLFFLLIIIFSFSLFRALKYRNSYLVKDSFDNWCITQEIEDLDDRRKKMDKPTILPLKGKELQKYKTPSKDQLLLSFMKLFVFYFMDLRDN